MFETLNYDTGRGGYNMADYRLPMDADGVKYHGTVDQNEENPGQFMYGLDENGNKRIIRTDEQGNVLTRVTGSIVEEVEIFNSVKIRDTSSHWELVDLSRFKSFTLIARSTLNEYPTIAYRTPDTATPNRVFKNGEWVSTGQITIEDTSNRGYLLNSFWTEFTDTPYASIAFRVRCDVAPTQGEFSLLAWGVLR